MRIARFQDRVRRALGGPPTREELLEQARRCRELLRSSIVDFFLPACIDPDQGGYYESLRGNKFAPTGEKTLVMQARQLWFFSTLAREGIAAAAARDAAEHGFRCLEGRFRDQLHGGYYAKVGDAGQPSDPRKHVYFNAFALFGLVAYHQATAAPQALEAARELFRVLEERAHDPIHGGYNEFFHQDWRPISDPRVSAFVGMAGLKSHNTHLHVLEAFAELWRAWPDPGVGRRLAELIVINSSSVRHPEHHCNLDAWRPDWRMVTAASNRKVSYGHDVECVWLTLDAAQALGWSPRILAGWAEALCEYCLQHGYDHRRGGFYGSGPPGKLATDRRKAWWAQAEGLLALLWMYRLTGNERYYQLHRQTFDFVEKHQVAPLGGWWATCRADGSPLDRTRGSPWQGGYHNGRGLLYCAKLLEELAAR
jgi:mannobiose 2-epimerase